MLRLDFRLVLHALQIASILAYVRHETTPKYDRLKEETLSYLSSGLAAARDATEDGKNDDKESDETDCEHDSVSSVEGSGRGHEGRHEDGEH